MEATRVAVLIGRLYARDASFTYYRTDGCTFRTVMKRATLLSFTDFGITFFLM